MTHFRTTWQKSSQEVGAEIALDMISDEFPANKRGTRFEASHALWPTWVTIRAEEFDHFWTHRNFLGPKFSRFFPARKKMPEKKCHAKNLATEWIHFNGAPKNPAFQPACSERHKKKTANERPQVFTRIKFSEQDCLGVSMSDHLESFSSQKINLIRVICNVFGPAADMHAPSSSGSVARGS